MKVKNSHSKIIVIVVFCFLFNSITAAAQMRGVWLPPDGNNQKSSVTQWIGLVEASVTYHSPNVVHPYSGEDRTGNIWGKVVRYQTEKKEARREWRAGANANTVFSISHDVLINGQKLSAGKYGVFMIPRENEWTIIFSKEYRSWGAYAYDKNEDVLRINVKPENVASSKWLNYEFIEKENDKATVVMKWDTVKIPFQITVPNAKELYLVSIRSDLKYGARWESSLLIKAVDFCVENKINLEEALTWADSAISYGFNGQKNFRHYNSKSEVLRLLGRKQEAKETFKEALEMLPPDATAIYWEGRMLIHMGLNEKAMQLFQHNKKLYPKRKFDINLGLAHGYKALKDDQKTMKHLKLVLKNFPKGKENTRSLYNTWFEQLKKQNNLQ
jgi:tetratricopeptide (TPR) repeat protein